MAKPMIEIEIGKEDSDSMKGEMEREMESGMEEEDAGFMSLIEGVKLQPKVILGLVNAVNKVLPLFGMKAIASKELSPELARALSMISQAVQDACDAEECPLELNFNIKDLQEGEPAAMMLAGKIDRLSKTGSFRKFLKAKPTESGMEGKETPSSQPPAGDMMAMEKTAEQSPNIEALFASRM